MLVAGVHSTAELHCAGVACSRGAPPHGRADLTAGWICAAPHQPLFADLAALAEAHQEDKQTVLDENEALRGVILQRLARLMAPTRPSYAPPRIAPPGRGVDASPPPYSMFARKWTVKHAG